MADVTVNVDGYQHLDNTHDPSKLASKVALTRGLDSDGNEYLVLNMNSYENNVAIRLDALKRALRALDD